MSNDTPGCHNRIRDPRLDSFGQWTKTMSWPYQQLIASVLSACSSTKGQFTIADITREVPEGLYANKYAYVGHCLEALRGRGLVHRFEGRPFRFEWITEEADRSLMSNMRSSVLGCCSTLYKHGVGH